MSDTSPLSAMAIMGWLPWLRQRWQVIVIPTGVWQELADIGNDAAWSALECARAEGWLQLVEIAMSPAPPGCGRLHAGETEAIQLALASQADWLLVDDGDARHAASTFGLRIIGVLGMVVWAKRHGKISRALDAITELRRNTGFASYPRASNEYHAHFH